MRGEMDRETIREEIITGDSGRIRGAIDGLIGVERI